MAGRFAGKTPNLRKTTESQARNSDVDSSPKHAQSRRHMYAWKLVTSVPPREAVKTNKTTNQSCSFDGFAYGSDGGGAK
jgi:hypothetical protein